MGYAVYWNSIDTVRYLIECYKMDPKENIYNTVNLLEHAVDCNKIETVKYLIECCKMDPREKIYDGHDLLTYAHSWDRLDIARYLEQNHDMHLVTVGCVIN